MEKKFRTYKSYPAPYRQHIDRRSGSQNNEDGRKPAAADYIHTPSLAPIWAGISNDKLRVAQKELEHLFEQVQFVEAVVGAEQLGAEELAEAIAADLDAAYGVQRGETPRTIEALVAGSERHEAPDERGHTALTAKTVEDYLNQRLMGTRALGQIIGSAGEKHPMAPILQAEIQRVARFMVALYQHDHAAKEGDTRTGSVAA